MHIVQALQALVGARNVLSEATEMAPYLQDWRGRYIGSALAVVRPANTAEVAAVVRWCAEHRVSIVPQGGNTSLCGGATPSSEAPSIVLSLARLNRVRALDAANNTITVEAGCTLAAVQEAAAGVGRLFPLSLAAEGSCQIGGNLSTNAGGVQVLRYGNTRDLTLGLEVVLPDGRIWEGLRGLRKDNTGYDLKHLFIGAEGTLGVITSAVLKLYPPPVDQVTGWLSLARPEDAVALLAAAQTRFDARLTAFELISDAALQLLLQHFPAARRPTVLAPWYVLCEFSDGRLGLAGQVEEWLAEVLDQELVQDAALAQNQTQAGQFWTLREQLSDAQKLEGLSIKHDVSVPVSAMPEFLARAGAALAAEFPGIRIVAFGHLGDGNLHYNLSKPAVQDNADFIAQQAAVHRRVHDLVNALGGSISAEHGIGQLKRADLRHYKSGLELELMQKIKAALDPQGLMNPGKVL